MGGARLWAWLRIMRPAEVALVAAGTVIASRLLTWTVDGPPHLASMAVSNALLCAGSMMVNDWRDVAEDRINKPWKPIPSGALRRSHVLIGGLLALLAGVAAAGAITPGAGAVSLAVAAASLGSSLCLKSIPLAGNVLVAVLTSYPLWCWLPLCGWPSPSATATTYLALLTGCLLFRTGAELVKTAEDFVGDRASGVRTVATAYSPAAANSGGAGLMTAGLLFCWAPVVTGRASMLYGALLCVATALCGSATAWAVRQRAPDPETSRFLVAINRLTMALMAAAVALGLVQAW